MARGCTPTPLPGIRKCCTRRTWRIPPAIAQAFHPQFCAPWHWWTPGRITQGRPAPETGWLRTSVTVDNNLGCPNVLAQNLSTLLLGLLPRSNQHTGPIRPALATAIAPWPSIAQPAYCCRFGQLRGGMSNGRQVQQIGERIWYRTCRLPVDRTCRRIWRGGNGDQEGASQTQVP